MKKLDSQRKKTYFVAFCISIILFAVLTHLPEFARVQKSVGAYFNTVTVGFIIAYLMNPLAKFYERKLFRNLKRGRWAVSVFSAFVSFVAVIVVLLLILIPQLVSSIISFIDHLPEYQSQIYSLFQKYGINEYIHIYESSDEVLNRFMEWLKGYQSDIIAFWIGIAKALINVAIASILSIYLLMGKTRFKADYKELLSVLLPDDKLDSFLNYVSRCDYIVKRYMIFSLLDALIIGAINAIILLLLKTPHVGLISIIAGITNLIPTFGPVIGGAVGALLLLLDNPLYAVIFLVVTVVLQLCDGYIIKPRLFGNSLGISGLLILLAIVTLGKAFGVGGLLLAIPIAAIFDFTYREVLLPYLRKKKTQQIQSEEDTEEIIMQESNNDGTCVDEE